MRFEFADVTVDTEQVQIHKKGKLVVCEPRVFELLLYFCHHPLEAISRGLLMQEVWQGRIVSEAAVNRAIGELRKIIEDIPSSPTLIKTVSKVGYRLSISPTIQILTEATSQTSAKVLLDNSVKSELSISAHEITPQPSVLPANKPQDKLSRIKTSRWLIKLIFILFVAGAIWQSYTLINVDNKKRPVIKVPQVLKRKPITSLTGSAFNPSFDKFSQHLAYLYRANTDDYAQLYLQQVDGKAFAITNDGFYYTDVVFGTEGILYASRVNNLQQRKCDIVQINQSSHRIDSIIDCGENAISQLAFDSRRNRLLYQYRSRISEPYSIHAYQIDTARKQQITHPNQFGNNLGDYAFSVSSDSQYLAVIEYDGEKKDSIKIINLDDNSIIDTQALIDSVYGIIWHTNKQVLASNKNGLFAFDTLSLKVTNIENSDQFSRLALGKNKHSILTERSQTRVNIVSYSLDDESETPLTASSGISQGPTLGNKSNILAFISNRFGKQNIYIQVDDSQAEVTNFRADISIDIKHVGNMAWSKDDSQLIASINNKLYRYTIVTRQWQQLATEFNSVHYVAYSDQSILFSAQVDNKWNIWRLPISDVQKARSDSVPLQLTTNGAYSVQGNEKVIYYTKYNHSGLYQQDMQTGTELLLISNFPVAGWRHWQLRDKSIYYLLGKEYFSFNTSSQKTTSLYKFTGKRPDMCQIGHKLSFLACDKVELSQSNIWQYQLSN